MLEAPASYARVRRGGCVASSGDPAVRRREAEMLLEGSIVADLGRARYGSSVRVLDPLPELGLEHPVFRPGRAVTVPIRPSGAP